jgi:hypothetical protein
MGTKVYLLMLMAGCLLAGCAQQAPKQPAAAPVVVQKPVVMEPFRFHKLIEVSPGNDFDILSWGRGSSEAGSFEILHSDSANIKYTTTTGDLEGTIIDAYNSDMDMDGNPEILIYAKAKDTTNYAVIYAFEFNTNSAKANKLDFPKLTKSQRQGYKGDDYFYIKEGQFMREFPIYSDSTNKPSGAKRVLQYGLRNNEFTVTQLSKDSTTTAKSTGNQSIKKITSSSNTSTNSSSGSSSSSKKKKHKSQESNSSHKKKKRHHHNSD